MDLDFKKEVVQPVYIGMLFHCAPKTKTNVELENDAVQKESPLPGVHSGSFFCFSGAWIMCT